MLIFALTAVVFSTQAAAQDRVDVRSSTHKGYARIVFEWPQQTAYTISKDGGRVLLRFARAGAPDYAAVAGRGTISKAETISTATEPLQVAIHIPSDSRFRDFTVGNKVILDVYDSKSAPEASAPAAAPVKAEQPKAAAKPAAGVKAPEAPKVEAALDAPIEKPAEAPSEKTGDFSRDTAEPATPAPVTTVDSADVPAPAFDPHVITLTTVTNVGMSVFQRNGWLWLVIDNPELPVAPKLEGPQKDRLPPLEKIDVAGAAAYRMELPEGLHVYGDGGGLSWRIVLTPKVREEKAAQGIPSPEAGTLVWPLRDMKKEIPITDPVVGDRIVAVVAARADQYAGRGQDFVQLRTLDSAVGLAYVPKADDVKTTITPAQVSIGRPGGLALSRAEDMQPEKIRQAIADAKPESAPAPETPAAAPSEHGAVPDAALQEEAPPADPHAAKVEEHTAPDAARVEDIAKMAEEKPAGNNIYNFPRWEMGGLQALDKNQHVMMVELANKPADAQTEDIITMAKLFVANHRAPEALGLMRIAMQKVPELADNAEFVSLRGAAMAMADKYDEAFQDFNLAALQGFEDVKYWRAYTLAGLEDWRQAIDTMPSNMSPIAAYPSELRTPMLLVFAEIALRGGKIDLAEGILDILKPGAQRMPLGYRSAMIYLTGEAQRQRGDAAGAIATWEPLVKNGKDDLYRAKAGLSLTKLQLEQKAITPAQAIDRLEGMRYAWRGDELETLINYRLGQLYIDNKKYLDGLTILRNAASLTPSSDLSKDVRAYMTKSFRDIFANNRLGNLPPPEAIRLYEEFRDLSPAGEEGNSYVEKLAERLVDAELLGRASSLLEYHVNNRLQGDRKAGIAIRLAAIRLLDGNSDGALRALEIAQSTLDQIEGKPAAAAPAATKPENIAPQAGEAAVPASAPAPASNAAKKNYSKTPDPEKQRQIYLLKARALSMKNKPDGALEILNAMRPDADVNRLRADISWRAAKWEEAAMALGDLITMEDVSPARPLTDYQRDLMLNRAIALNLSGNRVALGNLRERYNAQMKGTTKGQMFEIVTRPRRPDMIGSREAIASMISEIDLFKGFLDGYSKMDAAGKPDAPKEPADVKALAPADSKAAAPPADKKDAAVKAEAETDAVKPSADAKP